MFYFLFKDTATTEIYTYLHTLSLHDALPIYVAHVGVPHPVPQGDLTGPSEGRRRRVGGVHHAVVGVEGGEVHRHVGAEAVDHPRSEEHTSELQSLMRISYAVF